MNKKFSEKDIQNEVILGYRKVVEQRYQYDRIRSRYDIPDSFDQDRVAIYRNYFLDQIYPDTEARKELDAAFSSLDDFMRHPDKLLRILFDSGSVLLRYAGTYPEF